MKYTKKVPNRIKKRKKMEKNGKKEILLTSLQKTVEFFIEPAKINVEKNQTGQKNNLLFPTGKKITIIV